MNRNLIHLDSDSDARLLQSVRGRTNLFKTLLGDAPTLPFTLPVRGQGYPAMNLWEDPENVYIECEVPGFTMEELDVTLNGDLLSIEGKRRQRETDGDGVRRLRIEQSRQTFERMVRLPIEVDAEKVAAELENGVLTITLPKTERERSRKIPINSSTQGS